MSVHVAQPVVRVGVLGVQGDGLLAGGDGLVVAAQFTVHGAQPVVRVGELGVQGDGLLVGGDGLVVRPRSQYASPSMMCADALRV